MIDPSLLTFAEKLQYEGYLRREETNAAILSLSKQGIAIKEVVRRTGYSRGLIRRFLRPAVGCPPRQEKLSCSLTFPGSTSNGKPAAEVERLSGARCESAVSAAALAL